MSGGDPGIASPSPNAVVAFVRGTDNAAWYNEFFGHTSGATVGWHSMGGNLTSGVTPGSRCHLANRPRLPRKRKP